MRELKREEYGAISGGQVTNLPKVFVDGPPSSSGTVEINTSTGLTRGRANEGCDLIGGIAKLAKKNPVTKSISPGAACKQGVNATINYEDATPRAICTQVDGGTWDGASRVCVR